MGTEVAVHQEKKSKLIDTMCDKKFSKNRIILQKFICSKLGPRIFRKKIAYYNYLIFFCSYSKAIYNAYCSKSVLFCFKTDTSIQT